MIRDSVSAHIPVYLFKRERLSGSEVREGRRLQKNFLKFQNVEEDRLEDEKADYKGKKASICDHFVKKSKF